MSPRPIELSLPDLPEVPITLGPADAGTPRERRRHERSHLRLASSRK